MKTNNEIFIKKCIDEYDKSIDRLAKLVRTIIEKLEASLKEEHILARVSGRIKTKHSLELKLKKWVENPKKLSSLKEPNGIFETVGDLAAVRVMTYVEQDRAKVEKIAQKVFAPRKGNSDFESEDKENDVRIKKDETNFYRATHMQIKLKSADLVGTNANLKSDHCELQITSMLAHVWNEIEHDIAYKANKSELSTGEKSALESLGLLTKSGDNIIANLIASNKTRKEKKIYEKQTFEDAEILTKFLKEHFGVYKVGHTQINFSGQSWTLLSALNILGINHPDDIAKVITPRLIQCAFPKAKQIERAMKTKSIDRNLIEPGTCDCILIGLFEKSAVIFDKDKTHKGSRLKTILKHYKTAFPAG